MIGDLSRMFFVSLSFTYKSDQRKNGKFNTDCSDGKIHHNTAKLAVPKGHYKLDCAEDSTDQPNYHQRCK